jgi:HEAT repeat protein
VIRRALACIAVSLVVLASVVRGDGRSDLVTQLRSGDVEARRDAALRLAASGDRDVVPALATALDDSSEIVRATVAGALGALGDPSAVPFLLSRFAREKRAFVRKELAAALGAIGDRSATGALVERVGREKDREARAAAVVALANLEDPAAAQSLLALLVDKDAFIRREAARGLGRLRTPAAVRPLAARLEGDEEAEVRRQAARALGEIGDRAARPALASAAHDADPYVADEAIAALARLDAIR